MPIPSSSQPAAPQLTAKERIYNTLKDWIVDGTLAPGEKISDVEIANYFSVSRTPVREAIQRLADQSLIDIFPGRESRVTAPNLLQLRQTYVMLGELHAFAVQFAYDKITPDVLSELDSINLQIAEAWAANDPQGVCLHDQAFHDVILQLADNHFLKTFSDTLYLHAFRVENLYWSMTSSGKNSADEHSRILQALQEHNLSSAVSEMRNNWLHTADLLEEILKNEGII